MVSTIMPSCFVAEMFELCRFLSVFFFVSVCSVLFDCLQFPYAAGICSLPCHAGLEFKAGLEMALNLKHPKIRVATFLEFLETWKCRRIRRRCGKRFKVREKVGEFV